MNDTTVEPCVLNRNDLWQKVKGRKAVFLDSTIWIEMADGKRPEESQPLKQKLQGLVNLGKVFCPLSMPLICELFKQEFSRLRTGTLMEELSLNASFSRTKEVFGWELETFGYRLAGFEDDGSARKALFTPFIGFFGSDFQVTYPPEYTPEMRSRFGQMLAKAMSSLSLTTFLQYPDIPKMADAVKGYAIPSFQEKAKLYQKLAKGDRSRVAREEADIIMGSFLQEAVNKLNPLAVLALQPFILQAPKDKYGSCYESLLPYMPAFHNQIEVMSRAFEDPNRKDKPNDFFNLEMMPIPLAYADVFFTHDKWIRERFMKPGDFLKRNKCKFFSTYEELASWLDTL